VRGRQEWSGRNHAVPTSDATSLEASGDALARLYLMVVRGSARKAPVQDSAARGHSNRQIARDLAIGEQTVKTHVRSILTKLGLQDRVHAAIFALRHQADSCEHRP
jgi:DNA-binding NarL/FixJ family response regulator